MPRTDTDKLIESITALSRRVRKLEGHGGAGLPAGGVSATDTTPPAIPTGLGVVAVTESTVVLVWNASSDNVGVTSYKIYRDGVAVGAINALSFTDAGLNPSTVYSYAVSALDLAGNESGLSETVSATTTALPADTTPPSTPTALNTTSVTTSQVVLTWNPSTDNVGVASYTLYRNGTPIASPTTPGYTDTNVQPSTTYTYTVDAVDAAGNHSGQSSAKIVTTPAPPIIDTWYVAVDGLATNTGAIDSPFSLEYALNGGAGGKILAGHTVYLRGGTTYALTATQVITGLTGTSGSRITVRNYPGERVFIRNGGGSPLFNTIELRNVAYVDFVGLEITMYNYTRTPEVTLGGGVYHITENTGYTQSNVRFQGCVIHDGAGRAVGSFESSDAIEYNGCIFYFNGSSASVDWTIWMQSAVGKTKKIKDCTFVHSAADAVRLYSDDSKAVEGITLDGNIFAAIGSLYTNPARGMMIAGTTVAPKNIAANSNTFDNVYLTPDGDSAALQVGHISTGGETTITLSPASNSDDGRWLNDGATFNNTSGLLDLGKAGSGLYYASFIRFPNVTVPVGATITSAVLTLTSGNSRVATIQQIARFEAADNPAAPTTWADADGRVGTTAYRTWNITDPVTGTAYSAPDLATELQEVIDRPGWASGNAVLVLLKDEAQLSTNDWWPAAFGNTTYAIPSLVITYIMGPTTATFVPTNNSDDGRFYSDGTFSNTGTTVEMGLASGIGHSGFVRFRNVTIPPGATITAATIDFVSTGTRAANVCKGTIKADKSAVNPTAPTTQADAAGRTRTTASVVWTVGAQSAGVAVTTPDIASVIQEIIDQGTWTSGNALQVFLDYDPTATNYTIFASIDHTTYTEPVLTVSYTTLSGDAGVISFSGSDNYFVGDRVDLGGEGYVSTTFQNNTGYYTGANGTGTEAAFPNNTWLHTYPTTGVRIWSRAFDWDTKRAILAITNWSGAATVTVSAADLTGLNIVAGDQFELRNCGNYYSDVVTATFDGTSFTVDMSAASHPLPTPAGGLAKPASNFPYFGVFHIVNLGQGSGGGNGGGGSDTTAPSVPTGLAATVISDTRINLAWNASTDNVAVAGYTIYRNGAQIATVSGTSYSDTGLAGSTTYSYQIDAYDAAGNHSAKSSTVSATTDAPPPPPSGANWYIGTNGGSSSSTAGTRSQPFALSYALGGAGGRIGPGDVVYILAGTYSYSQISFSLSGSAGNPIKFMPEPGAWVKFEGTNTGTQNLVFNSVHYVNFYDIEFTVTTSYSRTTQTTTSAPGTHIITSSGATQSYVKFFGCYFHDHKGMGPKWWEYPTDGMEFNACLFYYNGNDPQHDHNTYQHNTDGYERVIKDCIFHNAASYNVHCYDDTARPINNFTFDGCVVYKPTTLYGGTPKQNILIGGNQSQSYHNVVKNCFIYDNASSSSYAVRIGYTQSMNNTTITGNFSVGRPWSVENGGSYTISNNTIYCPGGTPSTTAGRFSGNGNTIATIPTSGKQIFVRKYDWDSKRANIIIYNFDGSSTVSLTSAQLAAAGVSISSGQTFELRNSADPLNDIITGTYNGSSITVPMTGRTVQTPFGGLSKPSSTFPTFGCFILRVTS